MTVMERTAYPRFKRSLTAKDLAEVYTPTPQERFLAHRSTKGSLAEFGFLVLLKTYQRVIYRLLLIVSQKTCHAAKRFQRSGSLA